MEFIENKDLLQAVFDAAPNGIAVLKPVHKNDKVEDFTILLFNDYTLKWIGNVKYEGKLYTEIFPMVKENGILKKLIDVAETGNTISFERWYESETMQYWFHFTAVKQGNLLVVTTEDITERKQSEINLNNALEAINKQQRLYDSITSTTPDLEYVFDLNYRFTYANKALLAMWGKKAEDAIGKGLRDNGYEEWHALMHEQEIDKVVATKKSIRGTVSFPHAELGRRIYDYIFAPVLNESGEVEAVAGTTRDITDLKRAEEGLQQSEAKLKLVIDQTPAPTLVLMGDDLIIEQINTPMLKLIGFGKEVIGQPLIKILPELEGQYVWEQVRKVYDEGVPFHQQEMLVPHNRTGVTKDYYYNVEYTPLKEDGRIVGMIQLAIDVTEQVMARRKIQESENRYKALSETLEQQVNERTKELQRSNEDLQQFAHVASHDLKEPVRKIKTFTHRLQDHLHDKLDEPSTRFIDRILVATDRMFNMIDGVLAYSNTNAGMQKTEPVNLNELIKNIETDIEVALQKAGGKIYYNDLPVVEGAFVLLYQLFYNLINNSVKFTRPDVLPQITITSNNILENNKTYAAILVEDNGIGFELNQAANIFETFTRLNPKDKYEGTGLGLSLCKKIAERHGGSIEASGVVDKGAKFIVKLPLYQKGLSI